jgi:lycopene beta-cyclase
LSDARGPDAYPAAGPCGYQKFLGVEYELAESPSPRDVPLIMDARVPQTDGYRFIYVLPITPTRVLIEDTYFSDTTALDFPTLRNGIETYAHDHGYVIANTLREESGVLPLPYGRSDAAGDTPNVTGYAGGWFHPATGYSLPSAIRVAHHIATGARSGPAWDQFVRHHRSQAAFCRLLNRLLFCGYKPEARRNVFERFYQLNEQTIARFYAMEMTWADRLRILFGGPPRGFSLARYVRNARKSTR